MSPITKLNAERMTGNLKWFNNKAGYGFITGCDGDYKGFIIADLLIRRTTGMPAAVQQRRQRSK